MTRTLITALGLLICIASGVEAGEPIEGSWKNGPIEIIAIKPCGSDFCLTMTTGEFAGKHIGKLSGKGANYSGEVTDPGDNKTYSGYGTVNGNSLDLKGCALKIFCKSVTWTRL
ncbi:DUF2147 domain-containing protein [Rhizobium sp. BK602]|uniref:DUF2147 domain-containing protein n=1 Tax=Rhizobium sp. BK602 TaxID=2586986 RepID=UPI00161631C8|nr:DUF2147 domain-containing protein [Rhizobium sp. BK602]MBB3613008.1 uncharacterized protein (DUF2147 family) [Rhizobium sp. BK602]